ncbi:MAG TPA: hypothetical protein VM123_07060 [archaeon]|nr:hypothetical protein [archaeon]
MLQRSGSVALILLLTFFITAFAQQGPGRDPRIGTEAAIDRVMTELDSLKARLDSINKELGGRLDSLEQKEEIRELEELLKEADRYVQKEKEKEIPISRKFHSGTRQLQALNPNISLTGDMLVSASSSNNPVITEPGDFTDGSDRFIIRGVDLNFEAPLDPFTRGKFFFGVDHQGKFKMDEAYMEWLNLFGNVNLKIGKFFAQFGELNRWHTHALPQFDRPRPLVNLFSTTEFGGMGISGNFLLPSLFAHVNEFNFEVFNGGYNISFANGDWKNLIYVVHLKNYYDLSRDTYLEIGLSGATGKNDIQGDYRTILGCLDLTLKWAPLDRLMYRTVEFRNEFFLSRRKQAGGEVNSFGFFSSLRGKMGAKFWIGERVDYSELPWVKNCSEWSFSPHLDYWQSEWVMMRLQYSYTRRDYMENDHAFIIQCCWAMGPHKHEAY